MKRKPIGPIAPTGDMLSVPQFFMLTNVAKGHNLTDGLVGRSEFGGASRTQLALLSKGFINSEAEITEAGKAELVRYEQQVRRGAA